MAANTSFRIGEIAKRRLAARAEWEAIDQLIMEGCDQMDFAGIVFRGPANDRRAALGAGPDVWEVISRLQDLKGSEERRIATLVEESGLHARQIRIAIDYAAEHRDEIQRRIDRNRALAEHQHHVAEERQKLLG